MGYTITEAEAQQIRGHGEAAADVLEDKGYPFMATLLRHALVPLSASRFSVQTEDQSVGVRAEPAVRSEAPQSPKRSVSEGEVDG